MRASDHRILKLRERQEDARRGLGSWMVRLKRASNAVGKQQTQIARLERLIRQLEET